tara:strand:+ start:104 stop:796 length:693 start_codon:yes stop_codon:yes gene_type:complete
MRALNWLKRKIRKRKIFYSLLSFLEGPYWKDQAAYWKNTSIRFEQRATIYAKLAFDHELQKVKLKKMIYSSSILCYALPIELTNGNDGRGNKWFSSAKVRKEVYQKLKEEGYERTPFDESVVVHVTRILGPKQRLWDSSSIGRGNWKEIEDALVELGWFHDDSPAWIVETRFFQDKTLRDHGPSILVEIFQKDAEGTKMIPSVTESGGGATMNEAARKIDNQRNTVDGER